MTDQISTAQSGPSADKARVSVCNDAKALIQRHRDAKFHVDTPALGSAMCDFIIAALDAYATPPAGARDAVAPDWRNDWLLDLMGEWDTPMPTGMFDAIVERLPKAPQPAATGAGDLPELLADLLEYMNERYDADHDGSSFVANEEMRLGLRIQAALAAQPAPTINSQRIEHMAKNFQIEVFQGEGSYCCIVVVKTMLEATGLAATNLSKGRHLILSRTDEPVTHKTSAAAQAFIDVQLFQLEG